MKRWKRIRNLWRLIIREVYRLVGVPLFYPVFAQKIISLLRGLAGPGMLPYDQALANLPVSDTTPMSGKTGGNDAFSHPFMGLIMTGNEHAMLTMFLKLKPLVFLGLETKYAYEFMLECYDRLYNWVLFTSMGLSSCPSNFKVRPRNSSGLTWNACLLLYLHLLGPRS